MATVKDGREAEKMVEEHYPLEVLNNIRTRKQGYTWIVTFNHAILGTKGEIHINAKTGSMVMIK